MLQSMHSVECETCPGGQKRKVLVIVMMQSMSKSLRDCLFVM